MSGKSSAARRKPSMADVADLAGVSVMTVSNVINRPAIVSEATQAKVHAAMRELRYRNNLVARSLRLAQPRQIAYVLPARDAVGNEYMDAFLHDLAAACQEADRNLALVTEQGTEALMTACENLYFGQSAAGFIISNVESADPRPVELRKRGLPFAAYGRTGEAFASPWSWAEADAALGIATAVDHVADRGHRELAFVGADPDSVTMVQREIGYRDACLRRGLTRSVADDRIVHCGRDLATGVHVAAGLLEAVTPPTAIICVADPLAAGVVIAMQGRDLVPGRDVAVTGYDDTPLTSFGTVGITSVRQPSTRIAAELVRLVIDRPEEPEHLLLPPTLVVRSSTDPAP
ncbi:LacI family transcriptional regulator [Glycomyces sp. TRM65418]|uniref:LacI family DNA-binding transcriptional regulator n=1 Tax=Glycomyces sp. TRM65418 TaxID=2867006 RepID=UPI001CE6F25A|nr:LacI family DNA-binding transcriptional regulator [Glycomyces sp. TRM65418]MCC3761813.1 LacI family transcriptional regulator [Glycomyces sp. TRM65418]QZD55896.1 LacI family transcriptional regulator [Glycomyces sp. TRM65418]